MSLTNGNPPADRASWIAPELRRLAASEAELGIGIRSDGGLEQFS